MPFAAIGSFIAGTFGTLVIAGLAIPLADMALSFDAGNYFALLVLGLTLAIVMAGGSLVKAMYMLIIGGSVALRQARDRGRGGAGGEERRRSHHRFPGESKKFTFVNGAPRKA